MASSVSSKKNLTKKELEQQINELENEVNILKKSNKRANKPAQIFKNIIVVFLVIVCALSINLSIAAGWLKQNIINNKVWTENTTQIIQNGDVQKEIANQITNEIFIATDAEQNIKEFLPPKASALSAPLTQNLKSYTNQQITKVLESEKFEDFWIKVNSNAHDGIIASLENGGKKPTSGDYIVYIDNDKLVLDLKPVIKQIQSDLSSSGLNFVSSLNTDKINKTVTLTEIESLPTVLYLFNVLNKTAPILFITSVISGAIAIYLSRKKRNTIMAISGLTALLMVLNVQALYFAKAPIVKQVSDALQTSNSAAATAIFQILTDSLITYNRLLISISLVILVTAFMSGPSKFAIFIRKKISSLSKPENSIVKHFSENYLVYISILAIVYVLLVLAGLAKNITATIITLVVFCLISFWLLSIRKD